MRVHGFHEEGPSVLGWMAARTSGEAWKLGRSPTVPRSTSLEARVVLGPHTLQAFSLYFVVRSKC